jgi:hypothetical protein
MSGTPHNHILSFDAAARSNTWQIIRPEWHELRRTKRNTMIHIDINGERLGTIDPEELTIDSQIELEQARGAKLLIAWLRKYAGTTDEQTAVIGKMKLRRIKDLNTSIGEAISASLDLPN